MIIRIPTLSLILLIGPSGSGKSFFAAKHFSATEIMAQNTFQAMITDDATNTFIAPEALDLILSVAEKRLRFGKISVVDANNVSPEERKRFLEIAKQTYVTPIALVFSLSENIIRLRKNGSPYNAEEIHRQYAQMRSSLNELYREGFGHVFTFYSEAAVNSAIIHRTPLISDRKSHSGPFDIIGNLHGCADELKILLNRLGYVKCQNTEKEDPLWGNCFFSHPKGRTAIFLGDMVDMGPKTLETIKIVRNMKSFGKAICLLGNHDLKFYRKLKGRYLNMSSDNHRTHFEIDALSERKKDLFFKETFSFMGELSSHYVLDNGDLVVAHAGIKESMQGRDVPMVRQFTLYGETGPSQNSVNTHIENQWIKEYQGGAKVVYGHKPVKQVSWSNHTLNINTGCVYGGELTALRYPEEEIVSVKAKKTYISPLAANIFTLNN